MKEILLGGLVGLVSGIAQVRLQLCRRQAVQQALSLRSRELVRCLLLFLGVGTMLTALLMWLAVIDIDTVHVSPLHSGTLLGGVLFGLALSYAGLTPATCGSLIGAGSVLEGLCAAAGCVVGAWCARAAEPLFAALRSWFSIESATWFRVTLLKPYHWAGGFLGQACIGAVLTAAALCIRRPVPSPAEPEAPKPAETPADPQTVQEEALVVSLPGEEPVVVDTATPTPEPEEKNG